MQQQQAAARSAERAAAASEDARWARRAPLTASALPSRHASRGLETVALKEAKAGFFLARNSFPLI